MLILTGIIYLFKNKFNKIFVVINKELVVLNHDVFNFYLVLIVMDCHH